jgi:hypothetical protein
LGDQKNGCSNKRREENFKETCKSIIKIHLKKKVNLKQVKKTDLPTKTCIVCNRPFTWRKKWEKVWDDVKYCSDKCRLNKNKI